MGWFQRTFKMDREAAAKESEALFTPLKYNQRRKPFQLYCTAFGWGFLMTGLAAGGTISYLGWKDAIMAIIIGNLILVVIAGLCAIPGQQTGMGNSPVFKFAFGKLGYFFPAIILTVTVVCWQGATAGMLASTWAKGAVSGWTFVICAIIASVVGLIMTYFGIGVIEKFAIVATFVILAVGIMSLAYCFITAGGFEGFKALADKNADPQFNMYNGITQVVGAWVAGSIICTELSRFSKTKGTAAGMMIIGLPVCQIFLNLLGYSGATVFGSHDFTLYLGQIGFWAYIVAIIAMSFAILSSLDTNLYFPSAMFSFMANIPRKGGVVICGLAGLIIAALGLYAHYGAFLNVMGILIPPLAGPVIAEFFIMSKGKGWDPKLLHKMPKVNIASILGYLIGLAMRWACPSAIPAELWSLIFAIIGTVIVGMIFKAAGKPQGYEAVAALAEEPILPQLDDANLGDFEANFIHYDNQ